MPFNDIHNKEQKNGPMKQPLLTNNDLPNQDVKSVEHAITNAPEVLDSEHDLAKRAADYLTRPFPKFSPFPSAGNSEGHRGEVKDPEHDHRLRNNKYKQDDAVANSTEDRRDAEEEAAERQKAVEDKFEELQRLEQQRKRMPHHANKIRLQSSPIVTFDPHKQLDNNPNKPLTTAPPPGAAIPKPIDMGKLKQNPVNNNVVVNKQQINPLPMPNRNIPNNQKTNPFSALRTQLENHPTYGPYMKKLLGPNPTQQHLDRAHQILKSKVKEQEQGTIPLVQKQANEELHSLISIVATLKMYMGMLNKDVD